MQPTLAPAPHPPHQHLSSPGAQVQPSYLKDEHAQTLIEGWDDQQDTSTAEQGQSIHSTAAGDPHSFQVEYELMLTTATALRAHLLQNIQGSPAKPVSQASQEQTGSVTSHDENLNIDPAISGVGVAPAAPQNMTALPQQHQQHQPHQPTPQNIQLPAASPEVTTTQTSPESEQQQAEPPKRGGKRELSTSKRAAQNRAAQRAFRQRKEGYIKKLEEQVRDLNALEESYKAIQNENYQLRDYIISLQSRLIESQGEDAVPPAPILITHQQQPQQTLPFQPPPPGVTAIPHAPQPQTQNVHSQPQAAPTAPMVPVTVAPSAQLVPQAPMAPVTQPPATTQSQQQTAIENGNTTAAAAAAAKRAMDDETYNGYMVKKLRGEVVDAPAAPAQPATPAAAAPAAPTAAATDAKEVNGKS
ncbi:hypothetical protein BDZ91DRAFT_389363 [Kalaharituber pfeilii]|nr:hypothetical protein BDZ91DRAFT_389363 [Kalaharituber pfeilii]